MRKVHISFPIDLLAYTSWWHHFLQYGPLYCIRYQENYLKYAVMKWSKNSMVREQFGNPAALSGWRPGGPACKEQGRVTKIFLRSLDITSIRICYRTEHGFSNLPISCSCPHQFSISHGGLIHGTMEQRAICNIIWAFICITNHQRGHHWYFTDI